MKKLLPIICIISVICIFFQQSFLHQFLPIPSDTIIGLYHPFRDLYAKTFPNGIPYKNYLITDPVRQQYPWRALAISMEKLKIMPLWNPYNFSGYPLLANFQSAPFYPFNIFFFFLPFQWGWSFLIFLQPILGSIFLYYYLRSLKLRHEGAIIGSLTYVFSGFFIVWLEWNTLLQVALWLPLLLIAEDKLLVRWTRKWSFILFFSCICAFFGGHVQILFYLLCICTLYLFTRIIQKSQLEKYNLNSTILSFFPFLLSFIAVLFVTQIQWLPTLQFIELSARSVDQNSFMSAGWFIPLQHMIQFVAPDFFGNPTTLNYWGTWNYAELVGYVGIIPLIFAFYAAVFRHDKKTYFFTILCLLALLFAFKNPIAEIPYLLNIPLLATSQPTRLLFVIDFSLSVLAALGIDYFLLEKGKKIIWIISFFCFVFIFLWLYVVKFAVSFGISLGNDHIARQNLTFPSLIFFLSSLCIIGIVFLQKKKSLKNIFLIILALIFIIDIIRFATKFTPFTPEKYIFPQTQAITYLQKNIGSSRIMTTDSQIFPPNFSSYYHLQSVDGYDPLYLLNYGQLIAASERNKPDIQTPFGFDRIITPHNVNSRIIDLLGVRYVLSLSDENNPKLKKVFQEGQTRIYENMAAFPRSFFIKNITFVHSQQKAIEDLFDPMINLHNTAVVSAHLPQESYVQGIVTITRYTPNIVTLETRNSAKGYLLLTDIYYPTWHATIDGKETKIYLSDFIFRGIIVPSGRHTVVFSDGIL